MIVDLVSDRSLDPGRVGAKAAWLARGRRVGLPVLPGLVLEARASLGHMALGAAALGTRGSGGARLAMIEEPLTCSDELKVRAARLGSTLVARSSTTLEATGEWSGAFTSYLDLTIDDLPRGVVGCWASAFSVATLERFDRAGLEPGSVPMSVLVQPALQPAAGGTARVEADGTVNIVGIKGSPAPLLQGWVTGDRANWDDGWIGDQLVEMLGIPTLNAIASNMRTAAELVGATQCEWAVVDDAVWLLQLGAAPLHDHSSIQMLEGALDDHHLVRLARIAVRAPGPLGEAWVLPWALGGWVDPVPTEIGSPREAVAEATDLCSRLAAEVWGLPPDSALMAAGECLRKLRGPSPAAALDHMRRLRPPDPVAGGRLLSLLGTIRTAMVDLGASADTESAWYLRRDDVVAVLEGDSRAMTARVGLGQWEPIVAAVVMANGRRHRGVPASSGVGAGRGCDIEDARETEAFRPRQVVSAIQPVPALAPLLWDAAGLVTVSGSPSAHLFESARALGVPAVCGVEFPGAASEIVAVDGYAGVVASLTLRGEDDDV